MVKIPSKQEEEHIAEVERWVEDRCEFKERLDYDLDGDSVVLDVGGFLGDWAASIYCRYGSNVHIFEPVDAFTRSISDRFKGNQKLKVYSYGLGGSSREQEIAMLHDGSSFVNDGYQGVDRELCRIWDIHHLMEFGVLKGMNIDLMKINIEGGEFELLDRMIDTKLIKRVKNIQIQFHWFVDNVDEKMRILKDKLENTHNQTYAYEYVWENWEIIK